MMCNTSKQERLYVGKIAVCGIKGPNIWVCGVQMGWGPNRAFLHVFLSCESAFAISLNNGWILCCQWLCKQKTEGWGHYSFQFPTLQS